MLQRQTIERDCSNRISNALGLLEATEFALCDPTLPPERYSSLRALVAICRRTQEMEYRISSDLERLYG